MIISLCTKTPYFFFFFTKPPIDSIGTKVIDSKQYIIHEITKGETLYRLKVKYDVAVADIKHANNGLETLAIGQKILIPTSNIVPNISTSNEKYHVVQPGQTLYKISTIYKVPVDDIKQWNKLTSNSLTVGQKIKISSGANIVDTQKPNTNTSKDTVPSVRVKNRTNKKPLKRKIESGVISLADDDNLNYKYHYCLHTTAPIGSLVVLTCDVNNKTILVKVVGNRALNGSILVVNKAVIESLNLKKDKFNGSITFLN